MTIEQYDAYFKDIATRMAAIGHTEQNPRYANYHIEEVLVGLRTNLDLTDYCLLQEDITGQIQAKADEAVNDFQTGAIMIVKHVPHDDFAMERIVLNRALKLVDQVAAQMIKDKQMAINGTKPAHLRALNVSAFYYEKAQNLFDHCFGWRLEFRYDTSKHLIIDPDEWIT